MVAGFGVHSRIAAYSDCRVRIRTCRREPGCRELVRPGRPLDGDVLGTGTVFCAAALSENVSWPREATGPESAFQPLLRCHLCSPGPCSSTPQSESSRRTGALGSHVGVLGKRPRFDEQDVFIAGGQRRLSQKISVSSTRQTESHPDCKSLASRWGRHRWAPWPTSCLFVEGAEFPDVPLLGVGDEGIHCFPPTA